MSISRRVFLGTGLGLGLGSMLLFPGSALAIKSENGGKAHDGGQVHALKEIKSNIGKWKEDGK